MIIAMPRRCCCCSFDFQDECLDALLFFCFASLSLYCFHPLFCSAYHLSLSRLETGSRQSATESDTRGGSEESETKIGCAHKGMSQFKARKASETIRPDCVSLKQRREGGQGEEWEMETLTLMHVRCTRTRDASSSE